jgi:hypothetical protein
MGQNIKLIPILILRFISCANDHLKKTKIGGFSQPENYENENFQITI